MQSCTRAWGSISKPVWITCISLSIWFKKYSWFFNFWISFDIPITSYTMKCFWNICFPLHARLNIDFSLLFKNRIFMFAEHFLRKMKCIGKAFTSVVHTIELGSILNAFWNISFLLHICQYMAASLVTKTTARYTMSTRKFMPPTLSNLVLKSSSFRIEFST